MFPFKHTIPDPDGLYDKLTLPPDQSLFLWSLSWLSLGSGIYAITQRHYDLSYVPLGVWLTSINYWRKPDFSWRRYCDIAFVHISLTYQIYRSIHASNRIPYWITLSIGCSFFPVACLLHKKYCGISTLCHGMVHIIGNVSNCILYAGFIPSII